VSPACSKRGRETVRLDFACKYLTYLRAFDWGTCHFDLWAVRSEFAIKWNLCRTFSCLAATEPMGAYACRRRKREAPES
jgi:hypothetical protein